MPLDVTWSVSVKKVNNSALHAPIAIILPSSDNKTHSQVFNMISDLTGKYDESTEVYRNAEAVLGADGYNNPIQVIEYPKNDSSVNSVSSSGGSLSETSESPIAKAALDNLDPFNVFVIPTKDVPESDVESLSDALYNDRGGSVAYQVSDFDTMHKFSTHIQSSQSAGDGNVLGVFEDRPVYTAAQIAGYISANIPTDLIKVGNQSDFQATDLTADQVKDVTDSNFNVIENKSDMLMVSTGKSVDGSYLDHFVDAKYIIDQLTYTTQQFMNTHQMPYTQATIDELRLSVQSEANNLYKQNLFINYQPVVSATTRQETPSTDVGSRIYQGISVKGDLFNSIEKFNGKIQLDE